MEPDVQAWRQITAWSQEPRSGQGLEPLDASRLSLCSLVKRPLISSLLDQILIAMRVGIGPGWGDKTFRGKVLSRIQDSVLGCLCWGQLIVKVGLGIPGVPISHRFLVYGWGK